MFCLLLVTVTVILLSSSLSTVTGQWTTSSSPPPAPDDKRYLFNEQLDRLIKAKVLEVNGNDTLKIDPKQLFFVARKVGPINITSEGGFDDITLHGVTSLRRVADAYLAPTKYGNTELKLSLAVGPLRLQATGFISLLGVTIKLSYEAVVVHVDASAVLHYHPPLEQIYVKSFNLGDLDGIKLKVKSLPGLITPFVTNQLIKAAVSTLKPVIRIAVKTSAESVISSVVLDNDFLKRVMTRSNDLIRNG